MRIGSTPDRRFISGCGSAPMIAASAAPTAPVVAPRGMIAASAAPTGKPAVVPAAATTAPAGLGAALLVLGLMLVAMSLPASAQSTGGPYTMRKQVVGGGMRGQGGPYTLTGTAQQPIAFTQSAGQYRLTGGFHSPGSLPLEIFCDGFENVACSVAAAAAAVAVPATYSEIQE